jgi:hypothetical protein
VFSCKIGPPNFNIINIENFEITQFNVIKTLSDTSYQQKITSIIVFPLISIKKFKQGFKS